MPDFTLLRSFLVVAEEGHLTRAAQRLGISQPGLTHQMSRLERQLGVPLLERTQRQISLTEAGRDFQQLCQHLLGQWEAGIARLQASQGVSTLRIGFADYVNFTPIRPALRAWKRRRADWAFAEIEGSAHQQEVALRSGQLDVGFFIAPSLRATRLHQRRLWDEPFVLALPQHHPRSPASPWRTCRESR